MENNWKKEININNKKFIYEIIIPWGNPTALVELEKGYKISDSEKKEINNLVLAKSKEVEQVWFIYKDIKNPKLEMAWWEFCGNATRACVYKYFKDFWKKIENISVSWTKQKLETFIEKKWEKYFSKAQIPIYKDIKKIQKIEKNIYIVNMEWISHIIIKWEKLENLTEEKIKQKAIKKLEFFQEKYNYLKNISCLWIIYTKKIWEKIEIKPVIFVRSINISFYETACWSWTCAVWLVEVLEKWKSINLDILQPSKNIISVKVKFDWNNFINAYISWIIN